MKGSNRDFDAILIIASRALVENDAKEFSLCNTNEVSFPDRLDRKILNKIKYHERRQKQTKFVRSLSNIAAVFMAICILTVFLSLSIDGERKGIWSYDIDHTDSHIKIQLDSIDNVPTVIEEFRHPSVHPEHLVEKQMLQNSGTNAVFYYDKEDSKYNVVLVFAQYNVNTIEDQFIFLSEKYELYDIYINDTEAKLLLGIDGNTQIIWHDKEYVYSLSCKDGSIYIDYLIAMAESVK